MKGITGKTILLVEVGVIRGGNSTKVVDVIRNKLNMLGPILTLTLFENIHSKWKSDFVGRYYDEIEDLTFWWEKDNNHWIK